MIDRAKSAFVIVREELRLVGGEIDGDGAIAFAPFAGETEVEGFFHLFTAPTVANDFTLGHLPEEVGPTAGGVLFFAGHAEAWAHDAALIMAALPHSDAPKRGVSQTAVIIGKFEVRWRLPWMIVGPEAQVLVHAVGLDDLAG